MELLLHCYMKLQIVPAFPIRTQAYVFRQFRAGCSTALGLAYIECFVEGI